MNESHSKEEQTKIGFNGFYLSNAIDRLARQNLAAYLLITLLISAIPGIIFHLLGLEPFLYVSLLIYTALFIFLNLARWSNNFLMNFREIVIEKAEESKKKELTHLIDKKLNRLFDPKWHLLFGALVLFLVFIGALLLSHLEWFLIPSILILSFFTGITFWIIFQVTNFWRVFAKQVIGKLIFLNPLDIDRMGGLKSIAEHLVIFLVMEIILAGFAVAILLSFSFEVQIFISAQLSWALIFLVLGVIIGVYAIIVIELHRAFVAEKRRELSKVPIIPETVKSELADLTDEVGNDTRQLRTLQDFDPYVSHIIASKFLIDEIRMMREWPLDVPLFLEIIGGTLVALFVIGLRGFLLVTFGIFLP
jgi:hypothetical protein